MSTIYTAMLFLSTATNMFCKQGSALACGSYLDIYSSSLTDEVYIVDKTSMYVLGLAALLLHNCK